MKRKAVKIRKYAMGGEVENLDTLASLEGLDSTNVALTGDPVKPAAKAAPVKPAKPLTPAQILKNKYKDNPYLAGNANRYFWATQTNREFPLTGGNVGQAIRDAATFNKVDPALLYASAMEEGMSGAIDSKNWENASEAFVQWEEANPKLAEQFPVDGFYNYGLDQFAGQIPGLVKKGYLPAGFEKNVRSFDAYNEKDEKIKAAAFNTDANALMAKSAMMRQAQDQLNSYSKSKGYNLTPEQQEFFLLANYNGGQGNMQKMLDAYSKQGYLKNNDFLNPTFTPSNYGGIYKNVQARIQAAKMLRSEKIFKYGGEVDPEKPVKKGTSKVSPGLVMPFTDQSGQEGTTYPNGATGKVSPALQMPGQGSVDEGFPMLNQAGELVTPQGRISPIFPMPTSKVDEGFPMPQGRVDEGFVMPVTLPNGEQSFIYPNGATGRVSPSFPMPSQSVSGGFVMPFNAGGDEGLIYPNGATSKTSIPFPMPTESVGLPPPLPDEGNISGIFPMPIRANTKLRGVKEYAEGGEIETGPGEGTPTYSDQEKYYRSSAKLSHYKSILNEKLKAKNPQAFTDFFKGLVPLRQAGNTTEANKYIQGSNYNDYLTTDEVRKTLGNDYQDYLDSIQAVNNYDVAQGRQPLYGTKESGTDLNSLNYGRRFASLALTPTYSASNRTRGTSYNRSYTYDPKKKEVSFTETGDVNLRPATLVAPMMRRGGRMYANGTGDPVYPGQPQDAGLKNAPSFNPFGSFPSMGTTPINPQAPANEQIFRLDQNQVTNPNQQGNTVQIDPLQDGNYVNPQGRLQATQEQQAIADQWSANSLDRANRQQQNLDNAEMIASTGITAINTFFNKRNQQQQNRTNRRNALMQNINNQIYNPYAEGTGSQAIMKDGGTIHIKPENRGKFTAAAKRAGKSVQAYAAQIMANPDNYSSTLVKRANFARNAAKWHEEGGEIEGENLGFQILDGGNAKGISTSDHSNPMIEFTGREHGEGGIGVQYGGTIAEVEDKEIGWVDQEGGLNIFGKMKLPGSNMTFRTAAKNLAEQESKVDKQKHKYLAILNNSNIADPYQESARSTAKVMTKSLDKQSKEIAEKKEAMASYQSLVLAMTDLERSKMAYGGKMPKRPQFANGTEDPIKDIAKAIAQFESDAKYDAIGVPVTKGQYKGQRAIGKYQIMEDNVRNWGKAATGRDITIAEFIKDPALQDQVAEYQMRQIAKTNPNPADIASIWFTGQPVSKASGAKTDDLGTTGNQYVDAVMKIYNGLGGAATVGTTGTTTPRVKTEVPNILNYQARRTYSPTAGGDVIDTKYGSARKPPSVFLDETRPDNTQSQRGYQSPLAFEQIAPELLTVATNRRDPVTQLSYQPELKQTFDISYQLGRNENQSTFNQAAQIAEQTGNIGALSELAAQKYKADQIYNMQEVQGNAQQRLQTYNQNIDVLNDAQVKNLALIADQQAKQAQATFNTRATDLAAFQSAAAKVQQNRLENRTYNAYANLFKHYGFDKRGNVTFNPDNITRRFSPGEAQQFGMMAATQGAQAIMNGDFSRQFTKVKNTDGSTTTTETLGTNKKIQEEYKALKNQGFDDSLIGNMLRAKYPETLTD